MTTDGAGGTLSGQHLAILAGSGRLPIAVAESIVAQGGTVEIVAIGTPPETAARAFPHQFVPWGKVGHLIRALKGPPANGGQMVIAGAVKRPAISELRPDIGFFFAVPTFLSLLRGGDDAVLSRAIRYFEGQGLSVRGVHEIAPELIVGERVLGAHDPRRDGTWGQNEPARALQVLDALGDLDIGQAIVVEGGRVLGIEGAEGTDRLLARVAALRKAEDMTGPQGLLLKAPKPGQELRVDLPSIGPETVRRVADARLAGIAVAKGLTIALDQDEMDRRARDAGLYVVGLDLAERQTRARPDPASRRAAIERQRNNLIAQGLTKGAAADCQRAGETVARLTDFGTGHAAVAVGRHVLSVSAAEGPVAAIERTRDLRQWGMDGLRRGAAALRYDPSIYAPVTTHEAIEEAARQLLAAVVLVGDWPQDQVDAARTISKRAGVALGTIHSVAKADNS
jgi:DUF1009 family protein